jgi:hypothetical protein
VPYVAAMHCIAGVFIATDSQTDIVFRHPPLGDPYGAQVSDPSGWNIYDVRFAYDAVLDTAYFGGCACVGCGVGASLQCAGWGLGMGCAAGPERGRGSEVVPVPQGWDWLGWSVRNT